MNPDPMKIDLDSECQTCKQSYRWHLDNKPVHPFNTGAAGVRTLFQKRGDRDPQRGGKTPQDSSQTPEPTAWPFDPVLRQALIDKGVLTPDDLANAKAKIEAVTAQMMTGGRLNG
jgi:hypothetical protein